MDGPLSAGGGAVHEHGGGCVSLRHKTAAVRYFVATAMRGRQPGRRPARGEEGGGPGRRVGPQRCGGGAALPAHRAGRARGQAPGWEHSVILTAHR
jgi:hypothetical protein